MAKALERVPAKERFVRGPVGWLLGPELISKLMKILRKRSDPRAWMPYYRGGVHDECWQRDGKIVGVVDCSADKSSRAAEQIVAPAPATKMPEGELWFDYLADSGDGEDPVYAIAYTTMIAFDGDVATTTWPKGSKPKPLTPVRDGALPRGSFLFFGGDTAYHVADGPTLRARVEEPFCWAFHDARENGLIDKDADPDKRTFRLYGIPGNHDWYDNLEGFSLVFRVGSPSSSRADQNVDPIELPQLARMQLASYVAIQLPYGWQLWGLDIDTPLDARQAAYFQSLKIPDRLIVATPSPGIVFGASLIKEEHEDALETLHIPMPKVPVTALTTPRFRLDLSGDVHHYARYYPNDDMRSYGSVVSGLGGAFHHPTFTRATGAPQKVEPVCEYPTPEESWKSCANGLLTWRSTWFGSWARVIPFMLTVICGFVSTRSIGGAWLFNHLMEPWFDVTPVGGDGAQLMRAVCALGVFGIAVAGVVAAVRFGRSVYRAGLNDPTSIQNVVDLWKNRGFLRFVRALFALRRSYWFAWMIGSVAIAPFVLYALWAPLTMSLRLDIAAMVIVFVVPVAGAVAGFWKFGADARPLGRALVAFVGGLHASAQVLTAMLIARMFTTSWIGFGCTVIATVGSALALSLARPLFRRGTGAATLLFTAVGGLVLLFELSVLTLGAGGHCVGQTEWYWEALRFFVSGLAAMPLGTIGFIWYLAVAGRLNAHNNELGGAARVTDYRELIRFRVHEHGLTGYVIAVENPTSEKAVHAAGTNLKFWLIDVFTINTPPAPVAAVIAHPHRDLDVSALG